LLQEVVFGSAGVPPAIIGLASWCKPAGGTPALPNLHHLLSFVRNPNLDSIHHEISKREKNIQNSFGAARRTSQSCARRDALIDSANLRKMAHRMGLSFATCRDRMWLPA